MLQSNLSFKTFCVFNYSYNSAQYCKVKKKKSDNAIMCDMRFSFNASHRFRRNRKTWHMSIANYSQRSQRYKTAISNSYLVNWATRDEFMMSSYSIIKNRRSHFIKHYINQRMTRKGCVHGTVHCEYCIFCIEKIKRWISS